MDYVYICKHGDNEELRYSIRSVVKNLPAGKIWVVGGKPAWYSGDYIPVNDSATKFANIKECFKVVIDSQEISEDFVLMNDDFFVTKKYDSVPSLNGGTLGEKIERYEDFRPGSRYAAMLKKTLRELQRMGFPDPIDYDIHVPMVMNKAVLKKIYNRVTFLRSGYGNVANVGGDTVADVKVYRPGSTRMPSFNYELDNFGFISSEDSSFQELIGFVKKEFPEKTIYESI